MATDAGGFDDIIADAGSAGRVEPPSQCPEDKKRAGMRWSGNPACLLPQAPC